MAKYSLLIKPSAVREIEDLPTKKDRRRIVGRIRQLALAPRPPGCEKLSGQNRYRIRQGRYRVVYAIDEETRQLTIVKVGHRKDVYR